MKSNHKHSKEDQFKPLLNLTECRRFLGISRRILAELEQHDPTFPPRKTKTMHSRALLEQWLHQSGPQWFNAPQPKDISPRAVKFLTKIASLN